MLIYVKLHPLLIDSHSNMKTNTSFENYKKKGLCIIMNYLNGKGGQIMPKRWTSDDTMLNCIAEDLLGMMSVFPKRLIRVDELIRTFGMPLSHIQILVLLSEGDLSIGQISDRLGIAKPNITPLVDALDGKGYVTRLRNGQDRRVVYVHMLEAGESCLREIRLAVIEQIKAWPPELGANEAHKLDQSLKNMKEIMSIMDQRN